MGGDGGTQALDRRFIRGIQNEKAEGKNLVMHQVIRSQTCAQSSESLSLPIVACEMGNLFNKESILNALIAKTLNPAHAHIRGLKDIKDLKLTPNPAYDANQREGERKCMFICPVTSMEFNGVHPFVVIWSTGWVLSEKAIREIGIEALQAEYGPFDEADVVKLIPSEADSPAQREQMAARRELAKAKKDSKKQKRSREQEREREAAGEGSNGALDSDKNGTHSNGSGATHDDLKHKNGDSNGRDYDGVKKQKLSSSAAGSAPLPASASAAGSGSGSGVTRLTAAAALARKAAEVVESQESKSSVFKTLFHKGDEADKKDRDLFMSVSGLRYTLR